MIVERPLISVIVPAFNVSKYIKASIESILAQTYDNYEIIVINDGSTDDTLDILTKLNKRNEVLKIHTIANVGLSGARNYGLLFATGEFIYFLDSDDTLNSEAFENLLNTIKINCADLAVSTKYYKVNEVSRKTRLAKLITKDMMYEEPIQYCINSLIGRGRGWRVHGSLFKRDLISKHDIKYIKGMPSEDFLFNLKYLKVCKKVSFTEYPVENYLVRSNSLSQTFKYDLYNTYLVFDYEIRCFLSENNFPEIKLYANSFTGRNFINYIISIIKARDLLFSKKCEYIMEVLENPKVVALYKNRKYIKPVYSKKTNEVFFSIFRWLMYRKKYKLILFITKICHLRYSKA